MELTANRRGSLPHSSSDALRKIGTGAALVAAFIRAVSEPGAGLNAIEFWLLLFFAATTNSWVDDGMFTSDKTGLQ